MSLLLSGCGGPQNPLRVSTGVHGPIINGLWDGYTYLFALAAEVLVNTKYGIYNTAHHGPVYDCSYAIGIGLFLLTLYLIKRRAF